MQSILEFVCCLLVGIAVGLLVVGCFALAGYESAISLMRVLVGGMNP